MILFEKPGPENTAETLSIAVRAARERGIPTLVIASTTGRTALDFPVVPGLRLVCVSHVYGFAAAAGNEITDETRRLLQSRGIVVVTAAHALSGAERSLSGRMGGVYPVEVIAHTLCMFSQGVKVAVEISAMACDAGAITPGVPVIAIGGAGRGCDCALILRAQPSHRLLDTKVDEILCKPRLP